MGSDIIDLTYKYDKLALNYLENNPKTKYIFLSSGAAYGSKNFTKNVDSKTKSIIDIQDHYSIAKIKQNQDIDLFQINQLLISEYLITLILILTLTQVF